MRNPLFSPTALWLLIPLWIGCATRPTAHSPTSGQPTVALPADDPLLAAIERRLGPPDRVSGNGRMFLDYDLPNAETLTLVVSGNRIVACEHVPKPR